MLRFRTSSCILLASVGAALLATVPAAHADTYEMSAYTNEPAGAEVMAGDYDAAIASAVRPGAARTFESRLVATTNLCVAYTLKGAFSEALSACDRSVSLAKRLDRERPSLRLRDDPAAAKALSNRGVLRALTGDSSGAEADFRRAAARGAESDAASRNLAYLETTPAYRAATALATSD